MKILLLFLAGILIAGPTAFAQKTSFSQDSLIDQTNFKHDRQYFLDHYGTDDSTKALINTFFRVRNAAVVEIVAGAVVSGGSLLLINAFTTNHVNSKDDYGGVIVLLFLAPATFGGVALIVEGTITHLIYTRRKLLHIIANYQQGQPLPHRFTNRYRFKQELRKVKGIRPSILEILFPRPFFRL